ncbi:unnamed protein product [Amoebophrya sp. A120]|nr:unnamed protein product [Amoebophrya sp. A120]|eukprot:GSA120T00003511001.1
MSFPGTSDPSGTSGMRLHRRSHEPRQAALKAYATMSADPLIGIGQGQARRSRSDAAQSNAAHFLTCALCGRLRKVDAFTRRLFSEESGRTFSCSFLRETDCTQPGDAETGPMRVFDEQNTELELTGDEIRMLSQGLLAKGSSSPAASSSEEDAKHGGRRQGRRRRKEETAGAGRSKGSGPPPGKNRASGRKRSAATRDLDDEVEEGDDLPYGAPRAPPPLTKRQMALQAKRGEALVVHDPAPGRAAASTPQAATSLARLPPAPSMNPPSASTVSSTSTMLAGGTTFAGVRPSPTGLGPPGGMQAQLLGLQMVQHPTPVFTQSDRSSSALMPSARPAPGVVAPAFSSTRREDDDENINLVDEKNKAPPVQTAPVRMLMDEAEFMRDAKKLYDFITVAGPGKPHRGESVLVRYTKKGNGRVAVQQLLEDDEMKGDQH